MAAIGNERQLSFFTIGGHDHDGQNSTPVKILSGVIELHMLHPSLVTWIRGLSESLTEIPVDPSNSAVVVSQAIMVNA